MTIATNTTADARDWYAECAARRRRTPSPSATRPHQREAIAITGPRANARGGCDTATPIASNPLRRQKQGVE